MGGSSGGRGQGADAPPCPGLAPPQLPPVIVHAYIKYPFVFRLKFYKGGK